MTTRSARPCASIRAARSARSRVYRVWTPSGSPRSARRRRWSSGEGISHTARPGSGTVSGVTGVPSTTVSGPGPSARTSSAIIAPRSACRDMASRAAGGADHRSAGVSASQRVAAGWLAARARSRCSQVRVSLR
ncbi:hypothetical protein ACFQVA_15885 [Actinomadura keratinilytica]